jgi:hypothetical protein
VQKLSKNVHHASCASLQSAASGSKMVVVVVVVPVVVVVVLVVVVVVVAVVAVIVLEVLVRVLVLVLVVTSVVVGAGHLYAQLSGCGLPAVRRDAMQEGCNSQSGQGMQACAWYV